MTRFHDNPSPRMEEQICGKVELPKSRAGDSPTSELYQSKSYMEQSPQVLEDACDRWLWWGIVKLHHDVTQLGVFWHMVFEDEIWHEADPIACYWTQTIFLTYVAHLLRLQDIQNSSQTSHLIDQFFWIWLLKRVKMTYFSPFLTKLLWKVVNFCAKSFRYNSH